MDVTTWAETLQVGDHKIEISVPEGKQMITEGWEFDSLSRWEEPNLKNLAYLVDPLELQLVLDGEQDGFSNLLTIAVVEELEFSLVHPQDFADFKQDMMLNETKVTEEYLQEANKILEEQSSAAGERSEADIKISSGGSKLLPPHLVGPNVISRSTMVSYELDVYGDNIAVEQTSTIANTNTILYMSGKVIQVISSVASNQLETDQSVQKRLAGEILALNRVSTTIMDIADIPSTSKLSSDEMRFWADEGEREAEFYIGLREYERDGYVAAMPWWLKSAEQGYGPAEWNVGTAHENGFAVEKSLEKAAHFFANAANKGVPSAKYDIGRLYMQGTGVKRNVKTAVRWIREAAKENDPRAQTHFAYLYGAGKGLPFSPRKCYIWATIAATNGNEQADELREECASFMDSDEITDAQKSAKWEREAITKRDVVIRE